MDCHRRWTLQYAPGAPGNQKFRVYRIGNDDRKSFVNVLLEDSQDRVWCGTDAGLFRLERRAGQTEPVFGNVNLGIVPIGNPI